MDITTNHARQKMQKRLRHALREHREAMNKTQLEIAMKIGKSENTYQRWESTAEGLTNIFDLLHLFQILNFRSSEILAVFEFPPLSAEEVEALYLDEAAKSEIKESGIYRYLQDHCADLDNLTIEKLVDVITEERLKRRGRRQ